MITRAWDPNGTAICTASNHQYASSLCTDGAYGAIIACMDNRSGTNSYEIYAQKINLTGGVQWTSNGVTICTVGETLDPQFPRLCPDMALGAIITWMDYRSGTNYYIYAQRVSSGGVKQWGSSIRVCMASADQIYPQIMLGIGT